MKSTSLFLLFFCLVMAFPSPLKAQVTYDETFVTDKAADGSAIFRYDDGAPWKLRCYFKIPHEGATPRQGKIARIVQAGISKETIEVLVQQRFKKHSKPFNQVDEATLISCEEPTACAPRSASDAELDNFSLTCQKPVLLAEKKARIDRFTEKVRSYSNDLSAEQESLAEKKSAGQRARQLQSAWKERAVRIMGEYATFTRVFAKEYSPSYEVVSKALSEWARLAPASDWRKLVAVKVDLDTTIRQETFTTGQYAYRATDLLNTVEQECRSMRSEADPYQSQFAQAGLTVTPPEALCVTSARDLGRIRDYANNRSVKLSAAFRKLQVSLGELISVKQTAEVDAELRQSRADAAHLTASASFSAAINAAIEGIRRDDEPHDKTINVALLTPRLERLRLFQAYVIECQTAGQAGWKGTGCLWVMNNAEPAKQLETRILPMMVSMGLQRLEEINPSLLQGPGRAIRALLKSGEIAKAVAEHDALVRGFEVSP